jgi:beta-N-acetylhexosaminidase
MIPAIFGCAGPQPSAAEREFFRAVRPLGFILFGRNVESPDQVRRLTAALRDSVAAADAPILIDQEGGRVARLRPPHWRHPPPAATFGALHARDPAAAREAARLNAYLIGAEAAALGIDTICAPVLDVPAPGSHDIVGDRAFARDPAIVAELGRETLRGLGEAGLRGTIKHIPGHGRARADSHLELPVVEASAQDLAASDFAPFKALAGEADWAMTAHVLYPALDPAAPATLSAAVVGNTIRGAIGFAGLILTDDLSMKALGGDFALRTRRAFAAGCDVALHCNGDPEEMRAVALAAAPHAVDRADFMRRRLSRPLTRVARDAAAARNRLAALLGGVA